MVPRYSRPEMTAIWTPENRFRIWFEIEAHATDALAALGVVPKDAAAALWITGRTGSLREGVAPARVYVRALGARPDSGPADRVDIAALGAPGR